jgi:hypothetical protein
MSDLASLLEKVRSAKGADRELDVDIAWSIEPDRYRAAYWNGSVGRPGTTLPLKLDGLGRMSVRSNCAPLSGSIDAALALVERKLPGWRLAMYTDGEGKGPCCLALRGDEPVKANCHAPTLPLAILAALLTALSHTEQGETKP